MKASASRASSARPGGFGLPSPLMLHPWLGPGSSGTFTLGDGTTRLALGVALP